MANHTVRFSKHATAATGVTDTITLTDNAADVVEVKHRGTTGRLAVTTDGTDPNMSADDTYMVLAGESIFVSLKGSPDMVKVKSDASVPYSVTGSL